MLCTDPATAPHDDGVLIIDDTGDRKARHEDRPRRPPVPGLGRQDRQRHRGGDQPVGRRAALLPAARRSPTSRPTPAQRQAGSRLPHQAADRLALVDAALAAGLPFRAVVADCAYGENAAFEGALWEAGVPYVRGAEALPRGLGAREDAPHPAGGRPAAAWNGPDDPRRLDAGRAALPRRAHARPGGRPN